MDKKKTLTRIFLLIFLLLGCSKKLNAETPERLQFCDREYSYGVGNDSIKLFFNIFGANGKTIPNLPSEEFNQFFTLLENGKQIDNVTVKRLNTGIRLPKDFTFSVLLDQSIPQDGKMKILEALKHFIEIAPDSCIYISFYGDEVSNSIRANKDNYSSIEQTFLNETEGKAFYSGVYAKLAEFSKRDIDLSNLKAANYMKNEEIGERAALHPGKNILMIFSEGNKRPDDEELDILSVEDYQATHPGEQPKVYGFYYTADGEDSYIENTLQLLANPKDSLNNVIHELQGKVRSSMNMGQVLSSFEETIEESSYGYELIYRAPENQIYAGNIKLEAKWGNNVIGEATFTIGSAERPWPERPQSTTNKFIEVLVAVGITILTFAFFFFVMKVLVPYFRSFRFQKKYYMKYIPKENENRRVCYYCKQDLQEGQMIVTKCSHWMHKHCWIANNYRCAEYGQNCKTGIQEHVEWKEIFKLNSLKDCSQTIAGVLAGLISWLLYEFIGRRGFSGLSEFIVGLVFNGPEAQNSLVGDCEIRTSSFLMIGVLLGFFISLVFRYKDEIRQKDWKVWLKIISLSIFSAAVGFVAFGIGADIFCAMVAWAGKTYIPWYCSLPAYLLFSIAVSLSLTVKSSIPIKSALLGGSISSIIGFIVLYCTNFTPARYEWMSMLLDFIIFGGGLGASLVTVRMLAEKYFLVIQNGVKKDFIIPIHKWMNSTGGGKKVTIGMTPDCEIQMNWEKSNKVAKNHAQLYIDPEKNLPVIKPLANGVVLNSRIELPVNRPAVLSNGDTFTIGDTIFKYEET